MLATIGFGVVGIVLLAFAVTFEKYIVYGFKLNLRAFAAAYYCLASAFLLWAGAAAIDDSQFLIVSIICGDILLAAATILQATILFPKKYTFEAVTIGALVSGLLIGMRVAYDSPAPFLKGSLLYFNLSTTVAIVIGIVFCAIWLPASVRVAKTVMQATHHVELSQLYIGQYFGATVCALLFLSAHRPATIVLSFAGMGMLFALLTYSNVLLYSSKIDKQKRAKPSHAA